MSASWARWPPESWPARCVGSRPSRSIRAAASGVVPARVEPGAEPQVVARPTARRTSGCPGRRSRPWPAAPAPAAGRPPRPRSCRPSGSSRPTARLSSVVLPAPLGPTSPTTRPAGMRSVQSVSAHAPPVPLAQAAAASQDGGHATSSLGGGAKRAREQRLDALVVEPGPARLGQPALQVLAQRPVRGQRRVGQRPGHERAEPGPGRDQPLVLQLPVRLEHGVRVDRQLADHLLDRRQLVALVQQAEPQRLPDLLDQLQVGGGRPDLASR